MTSPPPRLSPARPARSPSWLVPAGSWDTHAHVFGPPDEFPLAPSRRYVPPTQPAGAYLETLDTLGVAMGVLVQPSAYGQDNSCLLAALDAAPDRLQGVVDIDLPGRSPEALQELTRRHVCGIRVAWDPSHSWPRLQEQAAILAQLGWHLDIRVEDGEHMALLAPQLAILPVPVMVESMGSPLAPGGPASKGFRALLELVAEPHVFVKLSHPYQIDRSGPPYPGTLPYARALAETALDKLVWGSDWPHPLVHGGVMPDDGFLLDLLLRWVGDHDAAHQVLCDNPGRFYGRLVTTRQPGEVPVD